MIQLPVHNEDSYSGQAKINQEQISLKECVGYHTGGAWFQALNVDQTTHVQFAKIWFIMFQYDSDLENHFV